jgi:hypothetical protein
VSTVAISPRDTATFAADLAKTQYVDDATHVAQGVPTPGQPPPGETRRHPSEVQTREQNRANQGAKTRQTREQNQGYTGAKETLAAPKSLVPPTQAGR